MIKSGFDQKMLLSVQQKTVSVFPGRKRIEYIGSLTNTLICGGHDPVKQLHRSKIPD